MALKTMGEEISLTDEVPIIVVIHTHIISYVKEYQVYKNVFQEEVHGETEPHKSLDKYGVVVKNDGKIAGHLPLKKKGKFAEMAFYFLQADPHGKCDITVTGKAINLGDGMQVPFVLHLPGQKSMVEI